jgi:hypothetical protein
MKLRLLVLAFILVAAGTAMGQFHVEKSAPAPEPKDVSTVAPTINASLRYGVSEIVPVANGEFYLLDKDLNTILRSAGIRSDSALDEAHTYAVFKTFPDAEHADFIRKAQAAIESHITARVTSNASGVAQFAIIPAGTYYVFGAVKTRNGLAIWNEFVRMTAGVTAITLDHNNVELTN